LPRRHFDDARTRAVVMTQHPLAVLVGTAVRARVTIDAQNRRGHFGALLLNDETERLLALGGRRVERNFPRTGNRGRMGGSLGLHVARGDEAVVRAILAILCDDVADELAVLERRGDRGEIVLDAQHELTVLEARAGGVFIRTEAVVERAFERRAGSGEVE